MPAHHHAVHQAALDRPELSRELRARREVFRVDAKRRGVETRVAETSREFGGARLRRARAARVVRRREEPSRSAGRLVRRGSARVVARDAVERGVEGDGEGFRRRNGTRGAGERRHSCVVLPRGGRGRLDGSSRRRTTRRGAAGSSARREVLRGRAVPRRRREARRGGGRGRRERPRGGSRKAGVASSRRDAPPVAARARAASSRRRLFRARAASRFAAMRAFCSGVSASLPSRGAGLGAFVRSASPPERGASDAARREEKPLVEPPTPKPRGRVFPFARGLPPTVRARSHGDEGERGSARPADAPARGQVSERQRPRTRNVVRFLLKNGESESD